MSKGYRQVFRKTEDGKKLVRLRRSMLQKVYKSVRYQFERWRMSGHFVSRRASQPLC